ncbi:hypothetical protein [Candidatus Lokiarchaeum ossiferum]|uniref:hypothetical protein n=1 Tax=Candidatus Lokiarchaeum ossiferum TaxID=2951803 RepID=UPI00352FA7EE
MIKTTYRFSNRTKKRKFSVWRSICALGILIGLGLVLLYVSKWTNFSITLDEEKYEPYRTEGVNNETIEELKENYENYWRPIINITLPVGIILCVGCFLIGNYVLVKIFVSDKSKSFA